MRHNNTPPKSRLIVLVSWLQKLKKMARGAEILTVSLTQIANKDMKEIESLTRSEIRQNRKVREAYLNLAKSRSHCQQSGLHYPDWK